MQTTNTASVSHSYTAVNNLDVFESAGFKVRGSRASCPSCTGHGRLTVAIRGELWYCHRCHKGGSVRQLARNQGIELPAPRPRLADIPKRAFREWLSREMSRMARLEHGLYRQVRYARACLSFYPEHQGAWEALRRFYSEQPRFENFWQLATDRIGRLELYRSWRRHGIR